eukprot:CAMPEP_0115000730 /NCGR_PEP_ID=MMETSP0216-20121206/16935_1 /TAXON_ID=223996 /ORGANISM="Protocruzia adherens, Strain Boccale" /LENGTH=780 /DNA_ID=CAMNT_0002365891 /DNA_START=18 /DNA_END=2360 /DNA_ORIENTATION=-
MTISISPFLFSTLCAVVLLQVAFGAPETALPLYQGDIYHVPLHTDYSIDAAYGGMIPSMYKDLIADLSQSSNGECSKEIHNILKNPGSSGLFYLLYSGKSIQDLGVYSVCTDNDDAAYHTVQLKLKMTKGLPTYTGLCLPRQCTKEDIEGSLANLIAGSNGLNDEVSGFHVTSPDDQSQYELGTGSKIMIAVCALVLSLSVSGFILEIYLSNRYHEEKRAEERARQRGDDPDDARTHLLDSNQGGSEKPAEKRSLGEEYLARNHPEVYKQRQQRSQKAKESGAQPRPGALLKKYHGRSPMFGVFNFLLCFAFYDNLKKVSTPSISPVYPELSVLNGIRVMSIIWVMWGHSYVWLSSSGLITNEALVLQTWTSDWSFAILMNATMSVDSFFFLGGLLSSMMLVGFFQKSGSRNLGGKFGYIYFHRFFRLLPLYTFLLFFFWQLAWLLPLSSPMKPYYKEQAMLCNEGWWTHLVFLNNFLPIGANPCFDWSWYLAVDMQCFLVIPILSFLYYKNKRLGVFSTCFVTAACIGVGIWVCFHFKENANILIRSADGVINEFYRKPYTRAPTYMIGVLFGFLYLEYKANQKDKRENNFVGKLTKSVQGSKYVQGGFYVFGLGFIAAALYANFKTLKHPTDWTLAENALYVALSRFIFTSGLAMFFLPNLLGVRNFFSWLMGGTFWSPLARVVYAVYLVHPMILFFLVSSMQTYVTVTGTSMWFAVCANITVSFFFGGLFSLLIEAPFMNLEKLMMGGGKKKKRPNKGEAAASAEANKEGKQVAASS